MWVFSRYYWLLFLFFASLCIAQPPQSARAYRVPFTRRPLRFLRWFWVKSAFLPLSPTFLQPMRSNGGISHVSALSVPCFCLHFSA